MADIIAQFVVLWREPSVKKQKEDNFSPLPTIDRIY